MEKNLDSLIEQVEVWAKEKGLDKAESSKQFLKVDFIEGFPNHVITTDGRIIVLSYEDLNGRIRKTKELKQHLDNDGYPTVKITHKGKKRITKVHRLVAETFIPNPSNSETVNHIDGDKTNNHVSNLEWATRSEQMQHAYKLGLKESNNIMKLVAKMSSNKPVKCVIKESKKVVYFLSARDCSREMGYSERWCDKIIGTQNGQTKKFDLSYVTVDELKENTDKVTMETLIRLVEWWSYERGLHIADSSKQFCKLVEEAGEVASALVRGQVEELKDGIGDVIVTLIILAQQQGLTVEECLAYAYEEIKSRTGKMVNGVFVKASDLK